MLESLDQFDDEYKAREQELNEIASPAVSTERASYNLLVSERAEVRFNPGEDRPPQSPDKPSAPNLTPSGSESGGGPSTTKTQVPKNVLDEFAQTIEDILQEWHFPNARSGILLMRASGISR